MFLTGLPTATRVFVLSALALLAVVVAMEVSGSGTPSASSQVPQTRTVSIFGADSDDRLGLALHALELDSTDDTPELFVGSPVAEGPLNDRRWAGDLYVFFSDSGGSPPTCARLRYQSRACSPYGPVPTSISAGQRQTIRIPIPTTRGK